MGVSPDPIKSAAEGATKGGLEWTQQVILDLVKQFRNRELAFIKDADNIELVKEERSSSEYALLSQWVPKGAYSLQIQMGLALREIAEDQDRVEELKQKIRHKYGGAGLHVAETTEVGIITELLSHLVALYHEPSEVTKRLVYFLNNIEDLVIFVTRGDKSRGKATMIANRLESFTAHMVIVFGSGYAKDVVKEILRGIRKHPRGYVIEAREQGLQLTAFIFTPELKAKISRWSDSLGP